MISQWIRVIHSDNGVLSDKTIEAQNNDSIPLPIVAAEDAIYIGQAFPFNNFHIDMSTVNDAASSISIEYWNKEWNQAVDILDETKLAGATFGEDGVIQFSPDRNVGGWTRVSDPRQETDPSWGLSSIAAFDLYWIKLTFSADFNAASVLNSISYAFSNDILLEGIEPEIDEYKNAWGGASKSDWVEQIKIASQQVVADMKSREFIVHSGNVLRIDDVSMPTSYKTLVNIYAILGKDFTEKREFFVKRYNELMSKKRFTIDKDNDGFADRSEVENRFGRGVR